MSRTPRVVQTPGAPIETPESVLQPETGKDEPQSEADELASLRAELAALKSAKAERDTAIAQSDRAQMSERLTSNRPGDLRASEVDPAKIRRAVLTRDGWVCPAESPVHAATTR